MVGVETDADRRRGLRPVPSAQIRHEGFETTRVPENSFAATVGNVPFGRYVVYDPARHSIHNHFILKSLALTAPGGLLDVASHSQCHILIRRVICLSYMTRQRDSTARARRVDQ
jgi:hypothetical protein